MSPVILSISKRIRPEPIPMLVPVQGVGNCAGSDRIGLEIERKAVIKTDQV